jgi:homopolymeric O-antigen transport system permease protein
MRRAAMVSAEGSDLERDGVNQWPSMPGRATLAWCDLADGWRKRWMWSALAVQDIKLRYRGSMLGPFWMTISTFVMVVAMGVIYSRLFHMDVKRYLPYLAVGLIVWQLLSSIITEGCDTFLQAASVIQQVPIPFSIHVYRGVCRNFIAFAHNLILVPVGWILFAIPIDWRLIELVPAWLLLAVNGVWISTVLGLLSARFRDIPPIVASFLQVLFFLTPVIWPVEALRDWRAVATFNPLFAAIDVVRAPLLGLPTADSSWIALGIVTVLGCGGSFVLFARFRSRIAYWI